MSDPRRLTFDDVLHRLEVRSQSLQRARQLDNLARYELVAAASPQLLRPSEISAA